MSASYFYKYSLFGDFSHGRFLDHDRGADAPLDGKNLS